ncbi:unnamed protein product [Triticum turgidum subsp. durum]|uniref:Bet v I/Major latex protein domain-containing protein n=1 Tax=Triticum turgidum subsp. durum TaxID=4567 RepID=A0A9R1RPE7_TRITD|nr:unnamed protein product [Triticum turgidum subsp. durum]
MASKVELVVEVKSPAEKLWTAMRESTELFPKIFPEQYKSIETVEGDGKSAGTVRLIKYTEGVPMVTFAKEKVEVAVVNWTMDFDKASDGVPEPDVIKETAAKTFHDLDDYLLKN